MVRSPQNPGTRRILPSEPLLRNWISNRALPEHLAAFSRSHGYEITDLIKVAPQEPQEKSRYAAARRDGFDTVLEIQDFAVTLMPAEFMENPQRGANPFRPCAARSNKRRERP